MSYGFSSCVGGKKVHVWPYSISKGQIISMQVKPDGVGPNATASFFRSCGIYTRHGSVFTACGNVTRLLSTYDDMRHTLALCRVQTDRDVLELYLCPLVFSRFSTLLNRCLRSGVETLTHLPHMSDTTDLLKPTCKQTGMSGYVS